MSNEELPDLGPSGSRLWDGLNDVGPLSAAERVLAIEACRITDRLDKLDALITGDAETWIDIIETRGNPDVAEVIINKPLAEARQQALALKQIFTELRQLRGAAGDAGGDEVDELAIARAKRIAAASGS